MLKFTGREQDIETGFYYYRARYYDPITGRFISEDPKGFGAGVNFYVYANNNPINANDPSGDDAYYIAFAGGGAISTIDKGVNVSRGYVIDDSGNFGNYTTYGGGSSTSGAFGGISFGFLTSTNRNYSPTINDFGGPFANASLGVGSNGLYGTVDGFIDPNTPTNMGGGLTIGGGTPGLAASIGLSNTVVTPQGNISNYIANMFQPNAVSAPAATNSGSSSLNSAVVNSVFNNATNSASDDENNAAAADGGFVLYPNMSNTNQLQSVYRKP